MDLQLMKGADAVEKKNMAVCDMSASFVRMYTL
jgi:hypothetical protein